MRGSSATCVEPALEQSPHQCQRSPQYPPHAPARNAEASSFSTLAMKRRPSCLPPDMRPSMIPRVAGVRATQQFDRRSALIIPVLRNHP
eukprot:gene954-biopygen647